MTNEEIIEKIRTTLAEEFEVDIDVIQPDAPLMETLELDSLDLERQNPGRNVRILILYLPD